MLKAGSSRDKWWYVIFFLAASLVVAADQFTKIWIRSTLDVGQSLSGLGFFRVIRVPPNTGAAFGLFQGQSFALTIVALVGAAVLLIFVFFLSRRFPFLDNWLNMLALGLILGGTIGNLVDRLNPNLGGVTDFISVGSWWPAFNIADSAITVGVIIFAYSLLFLAGGKKTVHQSEGRDW